MSDHLPPLRVAYATAAVLIADLHGLAVPGGPYTTDDRLTSLRRCLAAIRPHLAEWEHRVTAARGGRPYTLDGREYDGVIDAVVRLAEVAAVWADDTSGEQAEVRMRLWAAPHPSLRDRRRADQVARDLAVELAAVELAAAEGRPVEVPRGEPIPEAAPATPIDTGTIARAVPPPGVPSAQPLEAPPGAVVLLAPTQQESKRTPAAERLAAYLHEHLPKRGAGPKLIKRWAVTLSGPEIKGRPDDFPDQIHTLMQAAGYKQTLAEAKDRTGNQRYPAAVWRRVDALLRGFRESLTSGQTSRTRQG